MKRVITSLLVTAVALAGCDLLNQSNRQDPTSPDPVAVASVKVSPESTLVAVGASVRLSAFYYNEDGQMLVRTGLKAPDWFTYDASVATVDYQGNVTGVGAGTVTITASVDGKRGSTRVRVSAPNTPPPPPPPPPTSGLTITAIGPVPLIEGQSGIINGSGFGNVPSNLWVYVDGVVGKVTATNGTSLQFTVPSTGKPARTVDVQVRLLTNYSNTVRVAIRP